MDILLVFIVLFILTQVLLGSLARKHPFMNTKMLNYLYFYHLLFFLVYYTYTLFSPSDSKQYYYVASKIGNDWPELFESGTNFINFFSFSICASGTLV